jgi:VanZ family protein
MRWELVLLCGSAFAIGVGCLTPVGKLPILPHDKLLHFTAFGLAAWLAGRLVDGIGPTVLALAAVLAAGWIIELLQKFVPGRTFCWRDMAANAAGVASAGAMLALAHL